MRRLILLLLLVCLGIGASAVPAKRGVKRTITLADGSRKEVELRGDENMHFYASVTDGALYVQRAPNTFVEVAEQEVAATWRARLDARNERRLERAASRGLGSAILPAQGVSTQDVSPRRKVKWGAELNPISGKKKGLVLLVNFSDKKMASAHDQAYYDDFFNLEGFSKDRMGGSVHDYFYACSYGKFDLTFDVVGPYTMSKSVTYYGENDKSGDDMHAAEMVIEACKMAFADGIDFSQYDWDGDGYVDQVFVIYAGYGEAQGAPESTIWPHEYDLKSAWLYSRDGSGVQTFNGVKVDTYAVSCELSGTRGTVVDGIGTACHEFSHCFGLPDLYDVNYSGGFGMSFWDLLDSGSYLGVNDNSECPAAYSSYERMYCGWLQPTVLTEGRQVSDMPCLVEEPQAYILYNEGKKSEYYMLENRQQVGFDRYLPGHGMLILHVDFSSSAWSNNEVNSTASHQRMTLIPADNKLSDASFAQLAGDPWPGTSGKTAFTDTSVPAAKLFNANADGRKFMGKPLEDIAEDPNTGTISFTFDGGKKLDVPDRFGVVHVSDQGDSFGVSWMPVQDATTYELRLLEREGAAPTPEESELLKETFSKFIPSSSLSTNYEVTLSLNTYMETTGWTGEKLFYTPTNEIKLGSSSATGRLSTPRLTAKTGKLTILVKCRKYGSDTGNLSVKVGSQEVGVLSLASAVGTHVLHATAEDEVRVSFETTAKRGYVCYVQVFDGDFDESEVLSGETSHNEQITSLYKTDECGFVFEGLNPQHRYSVQVRALSETGASDWSELVSPEWHFVPPTDKVDGIVEEYVDVKIYDLLGRPVKRPNRNHLYIRGGRKVLKE